MIKIELKVNSFSSLVSIIKNKVELFNNNFQTIRKIYEEIKMVL